MYATSSNVAPSCSQPALRGAADLAISENFCNSTADEPSQSSSHQYRHYDLGALGAPDSQDDGPHASGARAANPRPRPLSPEACPAKIKPLSAPEQHRPSLASANGDGTSPSVINLADMEQAIISSFETETQDGEPTLPAAATADRTADISGKGVNVSDDLNLQYDRIASLVERESDENRSHTHTNAVETSATQSPPAQREMGQDGNEVVTPSFEVPGTASMGSRGSHILDMEADEVGVQGGLSILMDVDESDEDESEPRFVSDTTFHPLLSHHRQPYSHGFNIQQDDLVDEENGSADLAMEDAGAETREITASLTAINSLQPFPLLPSVSTVAHANFAGVPFNQTTSLVNGSMHESPMLGNPYTLDMTISEGVRLQHAAPPQDNAWPFVPNGAHPMPLVGVEMFNEPDPFIPRLPPIPPSNIFASLATSHSTFRPTSPSVSKAGPIPAVPSACRPTEGHKGVFKSLNREVDSNPAVAAGFQHEEPPVRWVEP